MILELDAGNTFIKWRLLDATGRVDERGRFLTAEHSLNHWPTGLVERVTFVRASSVAGEQVNTALTQQLLSLTGLEIGFARTQAIQGEVRNSYADPSRMGVDRWMVMLAAWRDCQQACCIVDCGSAITVDYLSAQGQHLGGYIMPGLRLLKASLLHNTAQVLVDQSPASSFSSAPGTHTSAAVEQGVNLMFQALQEKIVSKLGADVRLYITGGDGELFHRLGGYGCYRADLVMDGLASAVPVKWDITD